MVSKRIVSCHNKHHKSSPINITTTSFYLDCGLEKGKKHAMKHIIIATYTFLGHVTQWNSPVKQHSGRRDHMIPETAITLEMCSQQVSVVFLTLPVTLFT